MEAYLWKEAFLAKGIRAGSDDESENESDENENDDDSDDNEDENDDDDDSFLGKFYKHFRTFYHPINNSWKYLPL